MTDPQAVRWLKANLAVTTTAAGIISAAAGGLISATLFYSNVTEHQREQGAELEHIRLDLQALDARMNAMADSYNAIDKRLTLQEAQLKWAGDRIGSVGNASNVSRK